MLKICEKASVCRIGCRTRRTPHEFFYGQCTCLHTARQKQVVIVSSLRNCCKVTTKKSQIFSLHFQTSFPTFRQIGPDCNSLLTEKQYKYRKIQAFLLHQYTHHQYSHQLLLIGFPSISPAAFSLKELKTSTRSVCFQVILCLVSIRGQVQKLLLTAQHRIYLSEYLRNNT